MQNLLIKKTAQSPELHFESDGNLTIKGISNIHHGQKFYEPAFEWLNTFKQKNPPCINLNLQIYYLNTSASLILVDLLKLLNSFKEIGSSLNITWCYEEDDEDILDLGEDMQLTTKSEFEFLMIK